MGNGSVFLWSLAQVLQENPTVAVWTTLGSIILALVAMFGNLLRDALKKDKPERAGVDPLASILAELTRAITENAQSNSRLADVLERMEAASERSSEKIMRNQEEHARVLQGIDYRTKEILKNLERRE